MFLKSLELFGFKSFADKTHLDFTEGITSLLGPNGCGKSNIVNAIQWVLGEQSTKTLRASRMDDVIFNGTDTRKPMQFAEVTLTIDNENHLLASDATEIEIKRRIYRGNGANEYFLNRQQCNLRDIRNLFMDTGVGKNAYSILAQGRIDEILLQNPEQRRSLFEEAAGISRFKNDAEVAQRNLDKTNENIAQVDVILKQTHRDYMLKQGQAEKAAKARTLREERFSLEVDVQLTMVRTYRMQQEALRKQLADGQVRQAELQKLLADHKDRIAQLSEERQEHESTKINLQLQQKELSGRGQGMDDKMNMLTQRFQDLCMEKATFENRAREAKAKLDAQQENLQDAQDKLDELTERLDNILARIGTNTKALESLKAQIALRNSQISENEQQALAMQDQMTELQDDLARLADVIVVQLDEQLKASGYSAEAKKQKQEAFRSKLAALAEKVRGGLSGKPVLDALAELSSLFEEFVRSIPSFIDTLVAPEGIISRKHDIDRRIADLKGRMGSMQQHVLDLQQQQKQQQEDVTKLTEAISADQIAKADGEARKNGYETIVGNLRDNVENLRVQYDDMVQSGQSADDKIADVQEQIHDLEDTIAATKEQIAAIGGRMQEEEAAIVKLLKETRSLQDSDSAAVNEANALRDSLTTNQANITTLDGLVSKVFTDFFDNYGKSLKEYEGRLTEGKVEDYRIIRNKLDSIKKELDSMGQVNPMAEDEFNDVKKQYDFLSKQMDDLNKAKDDLQGVVEDIRKRSADLFLETYKQISENFQDLYRKLFGGGRAELRLVDPSPEHVLDTGIDIFAQPPGKKLVNLTALSGGERSMTAVALLFATYMVKASPFCILDEIDAALDDRNIGNFLAVLQGFAQKSQFIIITHNKHTVLGSSSMLGVTQIEPGVSTTVSYKLARVEGKPVIMDQNNQKVDFNAEGQRI